MYRRLWARLLPLAWAALAATGAGAQAAGELTLRQAFDAAWERQPEAAAQPAREEAAAAARRAAQGWLAEPAALELRTATDRAHGNHGAREYEAAVALPLWLPGERERAGRLADAEQQALQATLAAARLRTAAQVREAWWAWQRAALEHGLAQDRRSSARQLAADVARRVRAGDLARADQYQADGAAAQADAALADASAALAAARLGLHALAGAALPPSGGTDAELWPEAPTDGVQAQHPALRELQARAEMARRSADLAAVQSRANPELTLGTKRERAALGEAYQGSLSVGLRIPFGGGGRADAKAATARAEAIEAESLAALERGRVAAGIEAARERAEAARAQREAADQRARLAREVRGFIEKSFRLGESDLPTRLRAELEAAEAERLAARARIDAAAAVSALRQSLGLLPD